MSFIEGTPFPNIYKTLDDDQKKYLFQGDIIRKCNLLSSSYSKCIGYLIVSNSCDLQHLKKKKVISLVPIYRFDETLEKIVKNIQKKICSKKKEKASETSIRSTFETIFISEVSRIIQEEANYVRKHTFFLSPLTTFCERPSIAHIEDLISVKKEKKDILIKNRVSSLQNPWREKLGFMVGNLYNRVATFSPVLKDINDWWIYEYKDVYEQYLQEILK